MIHIIVGGSARRAYCGHMCAPDNKDWVYPEDVTSATCSACLEQLMLWEKLRREQGRPSHVIVKEPS